jgi:hypothetical protein
MAYPYSSILNSGRIRACVQENPLQASFDDIDDINWTAASKSATPLRSRLRAGVAASFIN